MKRNSQLRISLLGILLVFTYSCSKKTGYQYDTVKVSFKSNGILINADAGASLNFGSELGIHTSPLSKENAIIAKLGPRYWFKKITPTKTPVVYRDPSIVITGMSLMVDLEQPYCAYYLDTASSLKYFISIDSTDSKLKYIRGRFEGQYYLPPNSNVFNDPELQDTLKITEGKFELCK